jgi:hypothetical protein
MNSNGKQVDLTPEKLRTFKGFENITDSEAEKEIEVIKRLAKILHRLYMNEQNKTDQYENNTEQF